MLQRNANEQTDKHTDTNGVADLDKKQKFKKDYNLKQVKI